MKAKLVEGNLHDKNIWLLKFKKDLLQNRFNLKKEGLYMGILKQKTEELLSVIRDDYDT